MQHLANVWYVDAPAGDLKSGWVFHRRIVALKPVFLSCYSGAPRSLLLRQGMLAVEQESDGAMSPPSCVSSDVRNGA